MRSRRLRYISQRAATANNRDPQHDEGNQENQRNDIEPFGSGGRLIQRACTLLVVAGVGIMQLVWVALLAYATYATWQRLPL